MRRYRQTIDAPPDVVFPLLCPVREAEWLDGWAPTMRYSASGLVEFGAVFTTASPDEPDTIWIVTRHDVAARVVEFTRVTPGSRTCLIIIAVLPRDGHQSHVDISYTNTSLSPAGDAYLAAWTNEAFVDAMVFWERSMNHYLRTGDRLPRGTART